MLRHSILLLTLCWITQLFAQSTLESIPNQKLINGSYVSNPDTILSPATIEQLDILLHSLEDSTSAQVAVVAVHSIGDADIVDFAQQLFVKWGIGNKEKDNGLLVLLVMDARTVRFHTGYGLEGVLPDIVCKRIQREYMVPKFKEGDYNAGILAGLEEVIKILTDPVYAAEIQKSDDVEMDSWTAIMIFLGMFLAIPLIIVFIVKNVNKKFSDSKPPSDTPYPEVRLSRQTWLTTFIALPTLIVILFGISDVEEAGGVCLFALYFYFMFTLLYRMLREKKVIKRFLKEQDYYEIVEFLRKQQVYWLLMGLVFPLPFLPYFFYYLFRKRLYRNHPRQCKQCTGDMKKLNEKADDEYLTEGQRVEEKIRSVDYDVWKCKDCQSPEVWFYLNRFSKYDPCPKCRTIAYKVISSRTVVSATYSSSGSGEEIHKCSFCGHEKKSTYSIAQLVASTSSSSSSGSSSSGGSWGGGSSGGGGASSSW